MAGAGLRRNEAFTMFKNYSVDEMKRNQSYTTHR
jgi:hypothetical protein